jgi:ubiquitin-like protein Pup
MAEQERVQKHRTDKSESNNEMIDQPGTKADKLKADLDELLDEIDIVLEENAEEFVKNYVQKGGE